MNAVAKERDTDGCDRHQRSGRSPTPSIRPNNDADTSVARLGTLTLRPFRFSPPGQDYPDAFAPKKRCAPLRCSVCGAAPNHAAFVENDAANGGLASFTCTNGHFNVVDLSEPVPTSRGER